MPDRQTQPGRSDSNSLRSRAYQEDAKATLEHLVEHFTTGDTWEALQAKVRGMIQDSLLQVVREAFQDQDVHANIKADVARVVISSVRQELGRQRDEILKTVKGQITARWQQEIEELGQGYVQKRGSAGRRQEREGPADLPEGSQPPGGQDPGGESSQGDGERRPQGRATADSRVRQLLSKPWVLPSAISLGSVLLLVMGVFIGQWRSEVPPPRSDDAGSQEQNSRQQDTEDASAEQDSTELEFVQTMPVADAALPAGDPLLQTIQARPYLNQYRCWFDEEARRQLDYLVENRNLDTSTFQNILRRAYGGCVSQDYQLGTNLETRKLPVFAAQGTASYFLREQQKSGWDRCAGKKAPEGIPDPETFRSDGESGPGTHSLLNGLLTCTGYSANLKIGPNSTAEEYLFVVYAALKELERR